MQDYDTMSKWMIQNHGDAILKGDVSRGRLFKMALTVLVPYVVSTLSSVGAMREKKARPAPDRQ